MGMRDDAYKAFARALSRRVDGLSVEERQQAIVNHLIKTEAKMSKQKPTMMETLEWLIQDYNDGSSVALSVVSLRIILDEHVALKRELRRLRATFRYYKRNFAQEANRIDALLTAEDQEDA